MDILNKNLKLVRRIYTEELTKDQFFNILETFRGNKEEIKQELTSKTVKILKSVLYQLGTWSDSRDKKADLVNKVIKNLESYFLLNRSVSFMYGEKTYSEAKEEIIQGTTAETLQNFYKARREAQEEENKALNNPETLTEFRTFIQKKGKDKLTAEQLTRFEELTADRTIERHKKEEEKKAEVLKVDLSNDIFKLHETKHSKTGEDIFTVILTERTDKEQFKQLRGKAKQLNGYYSRYSDKNANPPILPGFNFSTIEEARKFMNLTEEDQDTSQELQEKKQAKQLTTAEKLRARAEKIISKNTEELKQERRTNTVRQASQAHHTESRLQNEIIFAKKLIKISEGLENGSIKYLHKLNNGKQLEQLESILKRGFYNRLKDLTYSEREKEQINPILDVNFIVYPWPSYYYEHIYKIFLDNEDTPGMKRNVTELLKYLKSHKNENNLVIFKPGYYYDLLKKTANKIADKWEKSRILDEIKDFERVYKMDLTNEATLKTALRELAGLSEGTGPTEEQKREAENKALERSFIGKKIPGFFPTPEKVIKKMFEICKVQEGETILEPSGGLGHIAEQIKSTYPENELTVNEYNFNLYEVLKNKGFNTHQGDFLQQANRYDVIFMNPPFENKQDIDHVNHAFNLLNPGGRLIAVMAGNKTNQDQKTQDFNQLVSEFGYMEQNEAGSFKNAFNSTGVNTVLVYLEKPYNQEEAKSKPKEAQEADDKLISITVREEKQPEPEAKPEIIHALSPGSNQFLMF